MGAYLEFQDLVLGLLDQANLEAYTVHDYIDTEQLGRRWDLMCEHRRHTGGSDIVTTLSIRLNSPLEVLLEEASALDWEPDEDANLDPDADGEAEVEVRLQRGVAPGDGPSLRAILERWVEESGAFDQFGLVQEERVSGREDTTAGGMPAGEGAPASERGGQGGVGAAGADGFVMRLRLSAYPEPQDFGRAAFWAAVASTLSDLLDLLHRQYPKDQPPDFPYLP